MNTTAGIAHVALTAVKEQCITVSSRLSRQIKDYSSAGNEPDLAPDERLCEASLVLAPVFITIYSRAYYDGFVISCRNQTDRPLYTLRNTPLMQRCAAIERVT